MSAASPDSSPAGGERAAQELLESLYTEHFRLVRGICRKFLRDGNEAEDAAQQTFLSAYRSLLAGNRPQHAPSWLATIARNECWARTQARMREPLAFEEPEGSAPGDAFSEAVRHEDMAALREALDELPKTQKEAFVLREFAGFSQGEISKALAISESALESLLVRARRRLRDRLEPVLQPLYGAFPLPLVLKQLLARLGSAGGGSATLAKAGSLPLVAKIAATTAGVAALAVGVSSEPRQSPALARAAAASPAADARSLEGAGGTAPTAIAAISTPGEPAASDEPTGNLAAAAVAAAQAESEGTPAASTDGSQGSGQPDSGGGSPTGSSDDPSGPGHGSGGREAGADDRSSLPDDPKGGDEASGDDGGEGEGDDGEGDDGEGEGDSGEGDSGEGDSGEGDSGEGDSGEGEDPESSGSGETTDGDSSGEGSGESESPQTEPPPETPDEPDVDDPPDAPS